MTPRERATVRFLTAAILTIEFCVAQQIVWPALAHGAPDQASAFVAQLRVDGFPGTDQALIANGRWACARFFSTDWNYDQVADKFRENNPMGHGDAVRFVSETVLFLCPVYGPRKNQAPGNETHVGLVI